MKKLIAILSMILFATPAFAYELTPDQIHEIRREGSSSSVLTFIKAPEGWNDQDFGIVYYEYTNVWLPTCEKHRGETVYDTCNSYIPWSKRWDIDYVSEALGLK